MTPFHSMYQHWPTVNEKQKENPLAVCQVPGSRSEPRKIQNMGEILSVRSPRPILSPCAIQPQRVHSTPWPVAASSCDGHPLTVRVSNAQRKETNPPTANCSFLNLLPLNPNHVTLSFFNFVSSTLYLESEFIYIFKLHSIFWRYSVPSETEFIKWCVWNSDKAENSFFVLVEGREGGGVGEFGCAMTSF
jgi:hypothetical protein